MSDTYLIYEYNRPEGEPLSVIADNFKEVWMKRKHIRDIVVGPSRFILMRVLLRNDNCSSHFCCPPRFGLTIIDSKNDQIIIHDPYAKYNTCVFGHRKYNAWLYSSQTHALNAYLNLINEDKAVK